MRRRVGQVGVAPSLALGLTLSLALGFTLGLTRAVAVSAPDGAATPAAQASGIADATTLYNAGTIAFERRAVGPSVTFLLAAARLEPRAPDVRANLASALVAASRAAGEEERPDDADNGPFPVAFDEAWWLVAGVLVLGTVLQAAGAIRGVPGAARWIGSGLFIVGIALSVGLHYAAWEESRHPEAVVIVPTLAVERGPDEPSRAAVLLSAGERVRIGEDRGSQVEIRLGANRIGWASREGLWRVSDAPRYTSSFQPR